MSFSPEYKAIYYSLTACFKDAVSACLAGVRREECPAAEEWRQPWLAAWDEAYKFVSAVERSKGGLLPPPSPAAEGPDIAIRRWRAIHPLTVINNPSPET